MAHRTKSILTQRFQGILQPPDRFIEFRFGCLDVFNDQRILKSLLAILSFPEPISEAWRIGCHHYFYVSRILEVLLLQQ